MGKSSVDSFPVKHECHDVMSYKYVTLETAWKVVKQVLVFGDYGHLSFFISAWGGKFSICFTF